MDPIEFEFGSTRNIPIIKEVEYMEMFIQSTEKFTKISLGMFVVNFTLIGLIILKKHLDSIHARRHPG